MSHGFKLLNSSFSLLPFEEKVKQARIDLQKQKRAKKKNILLEKELHLFTYLQEPRNKYEIGLEMSLSYSKLNKLLPHYEKSGIIKLVDYNPNKYKLSSKGLYTLHRIKEINKLVNNNIE